MGAGIGCRLRNGRARVVGRGAGPRRHRRGPRAHGVARSWPEGARPGLSVRFLRHDARRLADLGESFDTVLDCGLFHIFSSSDRAAFVDGLRTVLAPGGCYFMLGFSDRQPGDWGSIG